MFAVLFFSGALAPPGDFCYTGVINPISEQEERNMNRKRLGQVLIAGVFTACAAVIAALADLVAKQEASRRDRPDAASESEE